MTGKRMRFFEETHGLTVKAYASLHGFRATYEAFEALVEGYGEGVKARWEARQLGRAIEGVELGEKEKRAALRDMAEFEKQNRLTLEQAEGVSDSEWAGLPAKMRRRLLMESCLTVGEAVSQEQKELERAVKKPAEGVKSTRGRL